MDQRWARKGGRGWRLRPPYYVDSRRAGTVALVWFVTCDGVKLPDFQNCGEEHARKTATDLNEAWEKGYEAGLKKAEQTKPA